MTVLYVFILMHMVCYQPAGRHHDGCRLHVATMLQAIEWKVLVIDTLVDRSRTGRYVDNSKSLAV
jgi:hypothetical protein